MADNVSPFETQTHFLNEVSAFVLWKMILYFADVKNDTHIRLDSPQCARTDLNKRFLPKPMITTGWKVTP